MVCRGSEWRALCIRRDNAVALWDVYAPADASQPPRGPLDKLGVFNGGGGEADDTS